MEILRWAMLSLFTTIVGAIVGFGITSRNVLLMWYHLAGALFFLAMLSIASSFLGHLLKDVLSFRFFEVLFALGFIGIGLTLILKKPLYPGHRDLLLFACILVMEVGLLSFQYGLSHEGGYGLAFTISLLLTGSIVGGMVLGNKRWANWRVKMFIPHASGMLILLIGLLKML